MTEHGGPARRYGDIVEARGQRGRYAFSELFRRDQAKGGRPTWLHRVCVLGTVREGTRGSLETELARPDVKPMVADS